MENGYRQQVRKFVERLKQMIKHPPLPGYIKQAAGDPAGDPVREAVLLPDHEVDQLVEDFHAAPVGQRYHLFQNLLTIFNHREFCVRREYELLMRAVMNLAQSYGLEVTCMADVERHMSRGVRQYMRSQGVLVQSRDTVYASSLP